jgi:uncharacterized protein YecT (DUF1311 family)
LLSIAVLLGGCSNKPPGCSDPDVIETLRSSVISRAGLPMLPEKRFVNHPYLKIHPLEVTQVMSDGYDDSAKRHSCQATLSLAGLNGRSPVRFEVQGLDGKPGEFIVRTFEDASFFGMYSIATGAIALENSEKEKAKIAANRDDTPLVMDRSSSAYQMSVGPIDRSTERVAPTIAASVAPAATTSASEAVAQAEPAMPASLPSPSFRCDGELTAQERVICNTPSLAEADSQMARLYSQALLRAGDASALKQQQRQWRGTRDACVEAACMSAVYSKRIEELSR